MRTFHPTRHEVEADLLFGAAAIALGLFLLVTHELSHQWLVRADRSLLLLVARARRPHLTLIAVELTALGSTTLVVFVTGLAFAVLLVIHDRPAAVRLLVATAGAAVLTGATKNAIERSRPVEVTRLVQVAGYSYPSGHTLESAALYLTIALLAIRHVGTPSARAALVGLAVAVIGTIALTRVYLGVHYPSDVTSGALLGMGWALLLAGVAGLRWTGRRRGMSVRLPADPP